jgi:hypothetical protein
MARLIEEAHHLRAVTEKLLEEGRPGSSRSCPAKRKYTSDHEIRGKYGGPIQTRRAEFRGTSPRNSIGTNRIPWHSHEIRQRATAVAPEVSSMPAWEWRSEPHTEGARTPGVATNPDDGVDMQYDANA